MICAHPPVPRGAAARSRSTPRERVDGVVLVDLIPSRASSAARGHRLHDLCWSRSTRCWARPRRTCARTTSSPATTGDSDRYLFFLTGKRKTKNPFAAVDLQRLCDRVETFVTPRVARLTMPYLRERPAVEVGHGYVLWSPLENDERQILRLIEDARTNAELRRRLRERDQKDAVVEVIVNRSLWSAFQPIVQMETRDILGYEGLSRGPRGSPLEYPVNLFGIAARFDLVDELERACRRQAFVDWVFGAPGRLSCTVPPPRDVSFSGAAARHLGRSSAPDGYPGDHDGHVSRTSTLSRGHALLLDLGFTFAIDDVVSGYSGLEYDREPRANT